MNIYIGGIVRSCDPLMYVFVFNLLYFYTIGTGETRKCSGHLPSSV